MSTDREGRYAGKVALVTGGGSGMGRATALRLASEGARVAIADLNIGGAQETQELIGPAAVAIEADISEPDSIRGMVTATTEAFDGVDVLHANAGFWEAGQTGEIALEDWNRMLAVNLTGTYFCIQAALPAMRECPEPAIAITTSSAAVRPRPGMSSYVAAKAGGIGLTRSLAVELAPLFRVNAISPGPTRTPMLSPVPGTDPGSTQSIEEHLSELPLQHAVEPEEIAAAVAFLCSAEARSITGMVLSVDSGRHL